ncbi:very short patch repair endonuclease [Candidatus Neomarinimicrobiota bacterium]
MDRLSKERRSWNMSRIRSADTKPEIIIRSLLHQKGYRFRIHKKDLLGKPDIVLPKSRTVIFIHGCFWHRHEGCKNATIPSTNTEFWLKKLDGNVERDEKVREGLRRLRWNVLVVWECEIENDPTQVIKDLDDQLRNVPDHN